MDKDKCECDCGDNHKRWWKHARGYGRTGHIYGLGVVGALFYFLQNAGSFQAVLIGIFKAIIWPALIVFKTLELLKF